MQACNGTGQVACQTFGLQGFEWQGQDTCRKAKGRADEKTKIEPIADIVIFRLQYTERAMMRGTGINIGGNDRDDANDRANEIRWADEGV